MDAAEYKHAFPDAKWRRRATCAKFARVQEGVKEYATAEDISGVQSSDNCTYGELEEAATAKDFLVVQAEPLQDSNVRILHGAI